MGSNRPAVVTVNYRCADVILRNFRSTLDRILAADGHWYIVDNNSPDDSLAVLRAALNGVDGVTLIEAEINGGFGFGNNQVIDRVIDGSIPADIVYLLNPDAVPENSAIEQLLAYLDAHPRVGVVGSSLINDDGSLAQSMFRFPSLASEVEDALAIGPISTLLAKSRVSLPTLPGPGPVDWVSGASFMVRSEVLRKVGGFDEDFFLYWEEVEWCHRIRGAGFAIHGVPDARVRHIGGVSTGVNGRARTPGYWHESRNLYFRKTSAGGPLPMLNIITALSLAAGRCWQAIRGKPGKPPYFLRDHLKHAFRTPSGRRRLNR